MSTFLITVLVIITPMWFLQNTIHQLSHGLTAWFKWKWHFKIYPWPSNNSGKISFSDIIYEGSDQSKEADDQGMVLVLWMPKIVNSILIILSGILAISTLSIEILSALFIVFLWANLIDFTIGLTSIFRSQGESDIWRSYELLNISTLKEFKQGVVGVLCWHVVPTILITLIVLLS
jgi:hypothetical protein